MTILTNALILAFSLLVSLFCVDFETVLDLILNPFLEITVYCWIWISAIKRPKENGTTNYFREQHCIEILFHWSGSEKVINCWAKIIVL